MNLVKRTLLSLLFMTFAILPITQTANAVGIDTGICDVDADRRPEICDDIEPGKEETAVNPLFGPSGIITRTVAGLSLIIGVIAVIMIIIAGIKMTLSNGDPGNVKSARDQIIYAAVGLVIAVMAQAIVQFVLKRIGV